MKLSVAEVFAEAWKLYTRFAGRLILVAAIVYGFLSLVSAAIGPTRNPWLIAVEVALNVVGIFWVQGALVVVADDLRDGKLDLSIGETFRRVEPRLVPLILAGLVVGLAVGAGLVLLVIPGLILMAYWSSVVPAVVLERKGVLEAIKRSQRLASGDVLRIVVIIVISVLVTNVVAAVITALLGALPRFVDVYVAGVVANSITVPLVALVWSLIYFDLRLNKEGPWATPRTA